MPVLHELLNNPYFVVVAEDTGGYMLVRVTRTRMGFASVAAIREQHNLLITKLDRFGRKNRFLLIDLREAPGRRDPDFEAAMKELRPRMLGGFKRVGVWTASALGLMQVRRHTREDGIDAMTSTNEADLRAFFAEAVRQEAMT
jgi:hypothetical protein